MSEHLFSILERRTWSTCPRTPFTVTSYTDDLPCTIGHEHEWSTAISLARVSSAVREPSTELFLWIMHLISTIRWASVRRLHRQLDLLQCFARPTHRAFAKATPADGDLENWVRRESCRVGLTASARSGGKDLGERRVVLGKHMKPMVLSTKSTGLVNATSAISFTLPIGSYCGCMVMALAVRRKRLFK